MGVVEFIEPSEARAAFKALAYRRYKDTLIYLEKAPVGLFKEKTSEVTVAGDKKDKSSAKTALSGADLIESTPDTDDSDVATLFVKNLNFSTTPEGLRKVFSGLEGYRSSRINVKNDFANPGKTLSMGYGFVEFDSKANAQKALNAMQVCKVKGDMHEQALIIALQGYILDDHALQLKFSHSNPSGSTKKNVKKAESTKLVVHNVPFEATEKELRELFR